MTDTANEGITVRIPSRREVHKWRWSPTGLRRRLGRWLLRPLYLDIHRYYMQMSRFYMNEKLPQEALAARKTADGARYLGGYWPEEWPKSEHGPGFSGETYVGHGERTVYPDERRVRRD